MVNPYFCYVLSFLIALLTYSLGWSELYPPLSFPLLFFLVLMIAIGTGLGLRVVKGRRISFQPLNLPVWIYPALITAFIYAMWSVEFLYAGGIPLLKILFRERYNYITFGVPTLHVVVVTFSSFYTIYLFHIYLSKKKDRLILGLYCLNLVAAILIYNRAMLFFNLSASASIYLVYKQKISARHVFAGSFAIIVLLFIFGVLGSLRVSRLTGKKYSHEDFMKTGAATESFRRSMVPHEFFWAYIYISSPVANLQHNVNTFQPGTFNVSDVLQWVNNEILFDFISKRVNAYTGEPRVQENTMPGPFNASTIYSRSFSYLGWTGMALMGAFILLTPVLFFKILPASSPFFLTGLAILNTIFLFMVFDNTIRFTGLSFQLTYPVLFHYAIKKLPLMRKFF